MAVPGATRARAAVSIVAVLACAALFSPVGARAGTWVQASCVNPSGTASNSLGWSSGRSGPSVTGDFADTSVCGPGKPLIAEQQYVPGGIPPSYGSTVTIFYTPPVGSTLAGGSAQVSLEAYAYGSGPNPPYTLATVAAPDVSNLLQTVTCGSSTCSGNTFSGTVPLPADGGSFLAVVGCGDSVPMSGDQCNAGEQDGLYDRARVYSADFVLSTNAEPKASGFHGSALQPNAHGRAALVFNASDPAGTEANAPSGPGIYQVAVAIDGRTVFAGVPNTNGGACLPAGTYGGALVFDSQQPCPPAETVDVPVPTRGLPDGRHRLALTVTDAAGTAATVLDQYISTFNPQLTPRPRGRDRVRARFSLSWHWSGGHTTLRQLTVRGLPHDAAIAIQCRGRGCPRIAFEANGDQAIKRALRSHGGQRFRAGDRLLITVTAQGRRPERILLRIRDGRIPAARLLQR